MEQEGDSQASNDRSSNTYQGNSNIRDRLGSPNSPDSSSLSRGAHVGNTMGQDWHNHTRSITHSNTHKLQDHSEPPNPLFHLPGYV